MELNLILSNLSVITFPNDVAKLVIIGSNRESIYYKGDKSFTSFRLFGFHCTCAVFIVPVYTKVLCDVFSKTL